MIDLTGKKILVTGASKGIGAAIVQNLAAAKASVIAHYCSDEDGMKEVVGSLNTEDIMTFQADFRNKDVFTCTWAHGASPPANEMQFMFEQLLGISGMGLNLPTSGSPNIADSLIA